MLEGGGHSGPCKRCTSCLGLGGGHTGVGTNVSVLAVYTHGCCTSLLIPDTSRKSREKEGAVTPRYRTALNLIMCLVLDAQARACRCRWPRDAPPFPAEQGVTRVSRVCHAAALALHTPPRRLVSASVRIVGVCQCGDAVHLFPLFLTGKICLVLIVRAARTSRTQLPTSTEGPL